MKNIRLDQYKKAWIFRHQDLPISAADIVEIKPMSTQRANDLWRDLISDECAYPCDFTNDDWPGKTATWQDKAAWQGCWDSDDNELPELLATYIQWQENTTVYFCYSRYDIVETSWGVFKRCWKNFLFFDDGPLLLARKRKEVVQFDSAGFFSVGIKP